MNSIDKLKLLSGLVMLEAASQKDQFFMKIENPNAILPDLSYSGSAPISRHKSKMSGKQKKSRAASKRAKKARKNNR